MRLVKNWNKLNSDLYFYLLIWNKPIKVGIIKKRQILVRLLIFVLVITPMEFSENEIVHEVASDE